MINNLLYVTLSRFIYISFSHTILDEMKRRRLIVNRDRRNKKKNPLHNAIRIHSDISKSNIAQRSYHYFNNATIIFSLYLYAYTQFH